MKNLCFIDIETTGTIFGYHEIIELAGMITSHDGQTILGKMQKQIKPLFPDRITKVAQNRNHYSEKRWYDAEYPNEGLWEAIISFWSGCTPICHNPSFERAFITLAARENNIDNLRLDYHWIGTESLAWPLLLNHEIPKLSLSRLSEYFGLDPEPIPHIAMNGVLACYNVYMRIIEKFSYTS